ncbi:hypothetical protein AVEN_238473-1 [Araneus ventricosus]|uniref:Uncharacterized protein n=1 Tax=Araneus ventricosus TaxID=182803 RepID=A0A4Y2L8S4_ARAVE|nr:hypothetical protein AVEN_238473-1 [Araneus ventricosus]
MTRTTPELAPLLQREDVWPLRMPTYDDVGVQHAAYAEDLQWNRVSSLESSGPKSRVFTTRPTRPLFPSSDRKSDVVNFSQILFTSSQTGRYLEFDRAVIERYSFERGSRLTQKTLSMQIYK